MRRLLIAIGTLLVVIVLAAVGVLMIARNVASVSQPPPGPLAYSRSAAVRRADAGVARWLDGQFGLLARQASWLTPAGRSVLDECRLTGGMTSLFGGGTAPTYTCDRTDTRYYAFGGPDQARLSVLGRTLRRLGWGDLTRDSEGPPVMTAQAVTGSAASDDSADNVVLSYSWIARGRHLSVGQDLGALGFRLPRPRSVYIVRSGPDRKQIVGRLTAARQHILIVSIDVTYATKTLHHD